MTPSIATYHQKRNEKKPTHYHLPRRRRPAAPPGTALAEKKPLPEYLSLLQRSDCREAGATGGSQMKTITIILPDVEAAMLVNLQKRNRSYKDLKNLLIGQIQKEYQQTFKGNGRRS